MTGRSKVSLGERIKSLSILTKVVCVVIVVASVGAVLIVGLAGRDSIERWLMPSTRQGPVMTSPDGEWQARISWEDQGIDVESDLPFIVTRIDAWPAGEPDESRMVLYVYDEVLESHWIKAHTLELELDYEVVSWRIDVAGEPRLDGSPYYEWLAAVVSALFMILTPLPALVAVVLIVAVKGGKPAGEG